MWWWYGAEGSWKLGGQAFSPKYTDESFVQDSPQSLHLILVVLLLLLLLVVVVVVVGVVVTLGSPGRNNKSSPPWAPWVQHHAWKVKRGRERRVRNEWHSSKQNVLCCWCATLWARLCPASRATTRANHFLDLVSRAAHVRR